MQKNKYSFRISNETFKKLEAKRQEMKIKTKSEFFRKIVQVYVEDIFKENKYPTEKHYLKRKEIILENQDVFVSEVVSIRLTKWQEDNIKRFFQVQQKDLNNFLRSMILEYTKHHCK